MSWGRPTPREGPITPSVFLSVDAGMTSDDHSDSYTHGGQGV